MTAATYIPHFDYTATGELGPIQHVGGGRLCRHLTLGGFYAGAVYAMPASWFGADSETLARPLSDVVSFELAPYERNHQNRDLTAWGERSFYRAPRFSRRVDGSTFEHADYTLWNDAATALYQESSKLTATFNQTPAQFERGPWRAGYVGTSGLATCWAQMQRLSAHSIRSTTAHPAHFAAQHESGAKLRIVAKWEPTLSGAERRLAVMSVRGPAVKVPRYLLDWIEGRLW
jgi:hypothetical protein